MLKRLLIAFAVVIVGSLLIGFLVGLMLPSEWKVEASTTIAARPAEVWPYVSRLERWAEWAPWDKAIDPSIKRSFSGEDGAAGARMTLESERGGKITVVLTELEPHRAVRYELHFADMPRPARGSIVLEPVGERTKVTWSDEGSVGSSIIARYMVQVIEIAQRRHFELGLATLKEKVERR